MKTLLCWATTIPARLPSAGRSGSRLPALLLVAVVASAQTAAKVDSVALAHRQTPTAASRAALAEFATAHFKDQQGALALLALAYGDYQAGRYAEALTNFQAAAPRLPGLADHIRFGEARALIALSRKEEAVPVLESIAQQAVPASPHRPWAALMAGNLLLEAGAADKAAALAARFRKLLPEPQGSLLAGTALEMSGKPDAAALELQRVWYEYPRSEEAAKAEPILQRIASPPPATAAMILTRARKLTEGREGRRAAAELEAAFGQLTGNDLDMARVRAAAARHAVRDSAAALESLKSLRVAAGETDAERLALIVAAARRLERYGDVEEALRALEASYPKSRWRMEALQGAANRFLVTNDTGGYEPLFLQCAEFGPDPQAALCHWKMTWSHYWRGLADSPRLLREHVEKFPRSEDTPAALFFLARIAEKNNEPGVAKAYFEAIAERYPNFYYGVLARDELQRDAIAAATAAQGSADYLAGLDLPKPGKGADFAADDATRARIRRAQLLASAAADEWAEAELRFAVKEGAKTNLCAMELARIAERRGDPDQALRFIKAFAQGYLGWRFEDAPRQFWQYAFPYPYRAALERYAGANSLDPHLVAGLIRQESEFDPNAISRTNARGLTQVMPATGREIGTRLGIRRFRTDMLHEPDTNLKIGTFYLRRLLDSLQGKWHLALAAYNAGPGRAKTWMQWGQFREPAEFVESIPFHETRGYVQSVYRNADIYRRLYGASLAAAPSSGGNIVKAANPAPKSVPAVRAARVKRPARPPVRAAFGGGRRPAALP